MARTGQPMLPLTQPIEAAVLRQLVEVAGVGRLATVVFEPDVDGRLRMSAGDGATLVVLSVNIDVSRLLDGRTGVPADVLDEVLVAAEETDDGGGVGLSSDGEGRLQLHTDHDDDGSGTWVVDGVVPDVPAVDVVLSGWQRVGRAALDSPADVADVDFGGAGGPVDVAVADDRLVVRTTGDGQDDEEGGVVLSVPADGADQPVGRFDPARLRQAVRLAGLSGGVVEVAAAGSCGRGVQGVSVLWVSSEAPQDADSAVGSVDVVVMPTT